VSNALSTMELLLSYVLYLIYNLTATATAVSAKELYI
jgi:hypothetical protein